VPSSQPLFAVRGSPGHSEGLHLPAIIMLVFCVLRSAATWPSTPCGAGWVLLWDRCMMIISQLRTIFALPAPAGGWNEAMLGQLLQVVENLFRVHPVPAALDLRDSGSDDGSVPPAQEPSSAVRVVAAILLARIFGWHETSVGALPLAIPAFAGFQWAPVDVGRCSHRRSV